MTLAELKVRAYDLVFEIKDKQEELNRVTKEIENLQSLEKSGITVGAPETPKKKK